MSTKVLSPKLVYFIHSAPNEDGSRIAYSPIVCPVLLRTVFPVVEQILTNNYLLMDVRTFLGYNGLFNGSAVAIISDNPADADLTIYGKGNVWAEVFTNLDDGVGWLIKRTEVTGDAEFYVLADPKIVNEFDSFAWDSTVIEIDPLEPIDDVFISIPTLTLNVVDRWTLNVQASLKLLQANICTKYYGAKSTDNFKERI